MLINILDTLLFLNEIRREKRIEKEEYSRVCLTWLSFLLIHEMTFGTSYWLFDLIRSYGQIYVSIPLFRGFIREKIIFVKYKIGLLTPTPVPQSSPSSQ